jgi:hypothetical protein
MSKKWYLSEKFGLVIIIILLLAAYGVQTYRLSQVPQTEMVWISCNQYTLKALNLSECHSTFSFMNRTFEMNGTYDINLYGVGD